MSLTSMMSLIVFMMITTATPGPAMLYALESGTRLPFYKVFVGSVAISIVAALYATGAILGLSTIMIKMSVLYKLLKIAGGTYLVYLGIKKFRARNEKHDVAGVDGTISLKKYVLESVVMGLSNPKAMLFFAAVFPQFIPAGASTTDYMIMIMITFVSSVTCLSLYAIGGSKFSILLKTERVKKGFNRVTGTLFVGFGSLLLMSKE